MKKVVKEIEPQQLIEVNDCVKENYYGVLHSDDKYFITQEHYSRGKFITRSVSGLTYGNALIDSYTDNSLIELITKLLDSDIMVYQFNTYKQLFKWLAE